MDEKRVRADANSEWDAAVKLAERVAAGGELPALPSPVLLDADELLHADLAAHGWRYCAADVAYAETHAVVIGGPLLFGLVAAGSTVARRRARRVAEALAVAQWRPLGPLRILATDRRLLVWHEGAWASVWYHAVRELRPDLDADRLDLTFEADPPYSLAGPWVPYLAVVVATCLATRPRYGSTATAAVWSTQADPVPHPRPPVDRNRCSTDCHV